MTQNQHDDNSDPERILSRSETVPSQDIRWELVNQMVRLAIAEGSEKIRTCSGCGYLLVENSTPSDVNRVGYEIDVLFNSELTRAGALGSMVGNPGVLKRAMTSGSARLLYAMEREPADIRVIQVQANRAYFTVLSPFGI
jgi:hypothetical protein